MTTRSWIALLIAVCTLSIAATLLAGRVFSEEVAIGGGQSYAFRSEALSESREYVVHLPDGYSINATKRYPVLFVLDGTSQSGPTAAMARSLASIGVIPPILVVGVPSIDGETRNRDYTPDDMRLDTDSPKSANGKAGRFLRFLQFELIPRVESEFRTDRPRMLAGWSRGGLFVVHTQMAAPDLFDVRIAHSPALWREDDRVVAQLERALSSDPALSGRLYMSLGQQENEKMTYAFDRGVAALARSAPPSLRWRADKTFGGVHETNAELATPAALCFAFQPDDPCRGAGLETVGSQHR